MSLLQSPGGADLLLLNYEGEDWRADPAVELGHGGIAAVEFDQGYDCSLVDQPLSQIAPAAGKPNEKSEISGVSASRALSNRQPAQQHRHQTDKQTRPDPSSRQQAYNSSRSTIVSEVRASRATGWPCAQHIESRCAVLCGLTVRMLAVRPVVVLTLCPALGCR